MISNKTALLIALSLTVAACGQKGPLIVDNPTVDGQNQTGSETTATTNDTEARINRQIDGSPTIIQR